MTFVNILSFLRALPEIIRLIREVWGSASESYAVYNRKVQIKRVNDAIQKARETKDTSALEKFFNPNGTIPDGNEQLPKESKT